ncbi:Flavin reductase (NADPH) [Holothuria leucospilota]|uniref:Flavin reductase (NADPH) n=1 Tax=Holothuria leucospilota TaxID=206669 RepID=A0A9Q0YU67_HOLLE|nr:Flavin reductase (NADPH) [Holothuria leucospilota]
MKIAIVGATGATGLCLVQQAVDAGHEVVAIVRNVSKLTIQHENLKAVEGSIFSVDSLVSHFTGCDAVMSCLGSETFRNVTLYSDSIKVIIEALNKAQVSRFVVMTSWGTSTRAKDGDRSPFLLEWVFKPILLSSKLRDMSRLEKCLEDSHDINYTVVRPPILRDDPVTEDEFKVEIDRQYVPGLGYPKINRADVARFMLDSLKTDTYDKKMVAIAV